MAFDLRDKISTQPIAHRQTDQPYRMSMLSSKSKADTTFEQNKESVSIHLKFMWCPFIFL